jgi:hypothetical protein
MAKPDWNNAPEWAQWLAQDGCGDWAWYQGKPPIDEETQSWVWSDPFNEEWQLASHSAESKEWQNTLEQRP